MNSEILVIGDAHVEAGQDLTRFSHLGVLLEKRRPDVVVTIGDFLSMDCLSSWDRNNRMKMEGRRYTQEINAGREALRRMFLPVEQHNLRMARNKKAQWWPRFVFVQGNHEYRLERYVELTPELDGVMDIYSDLGLHKWKAEWIPYHNYLRINGILFCHIPFAKHGRPAARQQICKQALELSAQSIVFGHTHKLSMENMYRTGGNHLQQSLNVGCFFEHQPDHWAGSPTDFWKGVVILHNYGESRFDIETIAMSRLKSEYR